MALRAAWPALLLAPLAALTQLSLAHALVTPACMAQAGALEHAVAAGGLGFTLVCTALAWAQRRHLERHRPALAPLPPGGESDAAAHRGWLLARIAVGSGALSALVALALWIPAWLLPPCLA